MKEKNIAIVLAAGQGKRMNNNQKKQYLLIEDKPVLFYSLEAFEQSDIITSVVIVVGEGEEAYVQQEIVNKYKFRKVMAIVEGGKERYHSVYNGIMALKECDYVFIHDGARPFVDEEIIERSYQQVKESGACIVGMPVKDTIKIADSDLFVKDTPNRNSVWMIQTPQVFSYHIIKKAYITLLEKERELLVLGVNVTDDSMVVETFTNTKIKLVEGSYENIKITTPEDLEIAKVFQLKKL